MHARASTGHSEVPSNPQSLVLLYMHSTWELLVATYVFCLFGISLILGITPHSLRSAGSTLSPIPSSLITSDVHSSVSSVTTGFF